MICLKSLHLQTKQMLEHFGQTEAYCCFILFSKQKTGDRERTILRQKLIQEITQHKSFKKHESRFYKKALLNLKQRPECPFVSLSVSHCNYLGGFVFVFGKKFSIGFDIENAQRVTKKIISRISSKKEVQQAPHPALLWTAKEASLKCLSRRWDHFMLKDCLVSDWEKKSDSYQFSACLKNQDLRCKGIVFLTENLAIAYSETKTNKFVGNNELNFCGF